MKRADILDRIERDGPQTHGELNCAQFQLDRLVADGVLHRRPDRRYAFVDHRPALRTALAAQRTDTPEGIERWRQRAVAAVLWPDA